MSSSKNKEIEYLLGVAILMTVFAHSSMLLPFHAEFMQKLFNIYSRW